MFENLKFRQVVRWSKYYIKIVTLKVINISKKVYLFSWESLLPKESGRYQLTED